jgi:FkbM family methyltransferase
MPLLRRLLRVCVEPVRRALGTHSIAHRLDAVEQQLRQLEDLLQRTRDRSDENVGAGPFRFVTLPLPGGDTYQLALPRGPADAYHREIEANGAQTETWRFVIDWVRSGDVVIDMGANIGALTVPLARRGARVYAFELLQENARALAAAVERNELRDVSIVIAALRQGSGCVAFDGHSAWGSVAETGPLSVATMAIDDYIEWMKIARVDFIKIDIEGSEKAALAGAQRLLTRDSPDVLFESNALTCGRYGYSYRELMATLAGFGYRLYRVYGRRLCPVDAAAPQEVILTDYFATTKREEAVRQRFGMSVSPMTMDEIIDNILAQERENVLHKAFVVANAARLDPAVARDPRVSALLGEWDHLRSEPFFETLRTGST